MSSFSNLPWGGCGRIEAEYDTSPMTLSFFVCDKPELNIHGSRLCGMTRTAKERAIIGSVFFSLPIVSTLKLWAREKMMSQIGFFSPLSSLPSSSFSLEVQCLVLYIHVA